MHATDAALDQLREFVRLAQVLVLRHVVEDEAERVACARRGIRLELDDLVLHALDAARVLRLGLGEEVRLEAARAAGILPAGIGRVDVDADEQVGMGVVRDPPTIGERDERVAGARVSHVDAAAVERGAHALRDGERDVLLEHGRAARDGTVHARVGPPVSGVHDHEAAGMERSRWRGGRRDGGGTRRDARSRGTGRRGSGATAPRRRLLGFRVVACDGGEGAQLEAVGVPDQVAGDARQDLDDELERDEQRAVPDLGGGGELVRGLSDAGEAGALLHLDGRSSHDQHPALAHQMGHRDGDDGSELVGPYEGCRRTGHESDRQ